MNTTLYYPLFPLTSPSTIEFAIATATIAIVIPMPGTITLALPSLISSRFRYDCLTSALTNTIIAYALTALTMISNASTTTVNFPIHHYCNRISVIVAKSFHYHGHKYVL